MAAKAALARKNWKKRGNLWNQVSEAMDEGKLTRSVKEISDQTAYDENKNKARQERKHRHATKEDFEWSGIQSRQTVRKMKNPKAQWTWEEGDMAKIGRDLSYWGIPKDAICMIISPPQPDGYTQVLYDGQPSTISTKVLRPMGWTVDED
jgi:hypothetical protein